MSATKEPITEARLDEQGRPICCMCDKLLRKAEASSFWNTNPEVVQHYGWLGCGLFCSERHAAKWAVLKASTGVDN